MLRPMIVILMCIVITHFCGPWFSVLSNRKDDCRCLSYFAAFYHISTVVCFSVLPNSNLLTQNKLYYTEMTLQKHSMITQQTLHCISSKTRPENLVTLSVYTGLRSPFQCGIDKSNEHCSIISQGWRTLCWRPIFL